MVIAGEGEENFAVLTSDAVEEVFDLPRTQGEEIRIYELHGVIALQLRKEGEESEKIADRAGFPRSAAQEYVGLGLHVAAAVGDHGHGMAETPEAFPKTCVEVGIVTDEEYFHTE